MRVLCFLMIYVFTVKIHGDDEPEVDRENVLEKALRTATVIYPDYHLVARQIATDIYIFKSYKSVSLVFYPITSEVTEARFTFHSTELHLNHIGSCRPNEVIVNLKYGTYPAVNPDEYDFPKYFIDPTRRERVHTLKLLSNGKNVTYTIENPKPGIWYSLSYIKWEDPKSQKIVQQGLDADCQTILYSDLQVKLDENIVQIDCYAGTAIEFNVLPVLYKCMSQSENAISLNIKTTDYRKQYIGIDALSIPTEEKNIVYCSLEMKASIQVITFTPHPADWHYIEIGNIEGDVSRLPDCKINYARSDDDEFSNHTIIDLIRVDKGRFFAFNYSLPYNSYDDLNAININSSEIKSLRFKINQFVDIGGSLLISASLLMKLRHYLRYRRDLEKQSWLAYNHDQQFIKVVICMDIGHPSIPLQTGQCKYNEKLTPALFILNSIDPESIYSKTYIPFPESGTWYLTLRIFCDAGLYRSVENLSLNYVETSVNKEEDSNDIASEDNYTSFTDSSECSATIVLVVSSMSCVNSRCSNNGECRLHAVGGLVMSFCSCRDGYGSWDCSDNRRMDSRACMLTTVLLLTLSNLVFILSIYIAIIRVYYTEALMYTLTMFFSTFYHACDAPKQVSFCILRRYVLQFGDFYCAINSVWFTLLAMSIIRDSLRSFLQLIGVIITALLIIWNMFSFICFTFPAATGVIILMISWHLNYKKHRKLKYPRNYYIVYLPIGLIFMFLGFLCFAFLQTEQNYKVIHSTWHVIVALSIVVLLPDVRRGTNVNAFKPNTSNLKTNLFKYFHKSEPPPSTSPARPAPVGTQER